MKEVSGKYTSAFIHTENIEDYAIAQIKQLCDQPAFEGSMIRIMPDIHPGKVGPIGFTAVLKEGSFDGGPLKIMPSVVGIDIGCGIKIARLKQKKIEFQKLDTVIRENIPSGFEIRKTLHRYSSDFDFDRLICGKHTRREMAERSIGTLGGGNHFIEIDRDDSGTLYVVIHTGSRHLGKEIATLYMDEAYRKLTEKGIDVPYELSYLEGEDAERYIHDSVITQEYAALNRQAILDELVKNMKWKVDAEYDTVHNYVSREDGAVIIRKGAASAKKDETVIIPVNMKDGILIGTGKGNTEWNCSAPHGAGRIGSREEIRNNHTVSQYKQEMKGIYSTCINRETLDEAPFAYRSIEYVTEAVKDTVEIRDILKPVYNFKAGGDA